MRYWSYVAMRWGLFSLGVFVIVGFIPLEVSAQTASLNRNLGVGSRGPDVTRLQQMLNQDPATRVSVSGPGAPGAETDYFGPQTEAAVRRFQAKYAATVLTPVGLSSPTGYVGPSTRAQLHNLSTGDHSGVANNSSVPSISNLPALIRDVTEKSRPPSLPPQVVPQKISSPEGLRNLAEEHFDDFERLVRRQLSTQGASELEVTAVIDSVRDGIETADYGVFFENGGTPTAETILDSIRDAGGEPDDSMKNLIDQVLETKEPLSSFFISWLFPKRAYAQTSLIPYSSLLNVMYPCTCTGGSVWQMYTTGYLYGVPTEFYTDYIVGTQLYAFYTLPFAQKQKGFFYPQSGLCWHIAYPCYVVYSYGTTFPMVGSSLAI